MDGALRFFALIFDRIVGLWKSTPTQKRVSALLVLIFLAALAVIELNRQDVFGGVIAQTLPKNHYMAINLAFSLVLVLEVISLIFTLPASMSRALGKQFEILVLIFLRNAFKQIAHLPEPISISGHNEVLLHILAYGAGAIAIFGLLGVYLKLLEKLDDTLSPGPSLDRFIRAKKVVSLCMLVSFTFMGAYNGWLLIQGQEGFHFFQCFYTLLIFADILLVLIAQSFLPQFPAVFRNSGYALCTLLIRLSLTAPVYFDVLIGMLSVFMALFLTLVYNRFYTLKRDTDR
ncbi:MAG: hypothetical protein D3926_05475 [Desulfobacteraceae bacterium]|nr:MAG: hypothetical protein D3926_05475 [Desulfobacteraceae bacterium]